MSTSKARNAKNWDGEEWKKEVEAIKYHTQFTPEQRDRAFLSLRSRVYGLYYRSFASYARLFTIEGEEIYSRLDWLLWRCALKFDLAERSFFQFFQQAIWNAVAAILRHKAFLCRAGYKPVSLSPFTPDPKEVVHSVADEVKRGLSPIQRRILDLRLEGYSASEISAKTAMNEYEIKRTVAQIREATMELLEVTE